LSVKKKKRIKINPLFDIPRYLLFFVKHLGGKLYWVFVLTILAGLSEGFGIVALLPLIQLNIASHSEIDEGGYLVDIVENILGAFGFSITDVPMETIIGFIFISLIVKGILIYSSLIFSGYLKGCLVKKLKSEMLSLYGSLEYSEQVKLRSGAMLNIINEQVTSVMHVYQNMLILISQLLNAIVYIVFVFLLSYVFGIIAMIAGLVVVYIFKYASISIRVLSREIVLHNESVVKIIVELSNSIKYLQAVNKIHVLLCRVELFIGKLANSYFKIAIWSGFVQAFREPLGFVFIILSVYVSVIFLEESVATVFVSVLFFYRAINSILNSQTRWNATLEQIGSVEVINNTIKKLSKSSEYVSGVEFQWSKNTLEFNNVDFKYDTSLPLTLIGLNFNIKRNTTVAFVGASGSGKTTLIDLILLLLKPTSGSIKLGGINYQNISLSSFRSRIGYVSQDSIIFDDTILNNITLWSHSSEGTHNKAMKAVSQANLSAFIEELPEGLDTMVGEKGVNLSGGQRQRLFIARELYREPELLILDEATSALDSTSEMCIQQSIRQLSGSTTVVIISHRLSTVKEADKIFVLDKGVIVEEGKYEKLIYNVDSLFFQMVQQQKL
jgi:ABC-type multidrug transport system fused ATPase/permease subunit